MEVDVRAAGSADAGAVAAVHVASWRAGYRGLLPGAFLDALSVQEREHGWAAALEQGAQVLLAERDGQVAGFVCYGPCRDLDASVGVGEVYALYARPDCWGTGVGGRLLDAAVQALTSGSGGDVVLWVLEGNQRARGFYERRGWWPDGATKVEEQAGLVLSEVRYRWSRGQASEQ